MKENILLNKKIEDIIKNINPKPVWPWVKFPMSDFSRKIYKMMCGLNY
jgi:hypothetical protein